MTDSAATGSTSNTGRTGPPRFRWALYLASIPLVLFLIIPLVAMVLRVPPSELIGVFINYSAAQAIELSIVTTLTTTAITLVAGTPVAYLLARRTIPGKPILDTLIDLPVVLPPSVAGVALLVAFGRRGLLAPILNDVGLEVPFTRTAVVLAQLFVSSSYYIKSAAAGFMAVDRELEDAAAIDGASRFMTFWSVTLPLALPAVIGGTVLTWARAVGEFGATIIFAGNFEGRTQTIPLAIYMGFEIDIKIAIMLALILLAVSFTVLIIVKGLLHRRLSIF